MDVITTHVNADFDCLGAMIAAKRLYPEALLVFPGGQERGLRDFLLQSTLYAYDFKRVRDVDLDTVSRLILVDVRHARRIGPFGALAQRGDVELHIYDHHPPDEEALRGVVEQVEEVGATTTVMVRLFMERGIVPTADEATMMMLGLYEDTGSLLFGGTTTQDFEAAAFLLRHGANLNTVADFLVREMTPEQVDLLNELLKSCRRLTVNGVEVALAQASIDHYVVDLASLAHKLKDIENLNVLVVAVRMEDRIFLVGRSRLPEVHVGELFQEFGGGGHAFAASGTVRDLPLEQLLDQMEEALHRHVRPRCEARQLMSAPVKTLPLTATVEEARELLTRYNFNAAPVMDGERVVGLITRQVVEKAAHHRLLRLQLEEIMSSDFEVAAPETSLEDLQETIINHNQRFIPVVAGEQLVGAVTRTDLLRQMIGDQPALLKGGLPGESGRGALRLKRKNLARLIDGQLSSFLRSLLHQLGEIGDQLGVKVYLVGGFVRDLLLRQENFDIDLVVEGDGIAYAEAFARCNECRIRSHQKFGTAIIIFPDGFKIDIASARIEYYDRPAALPQVEHSSIRHDLYRRDFSINTLCIALNQPKFGQLLDFFGGQRDLKQKSIRVLHNLSFIEDPTRVFRAIRFEQRLGFRIGRQTERLMRSAVGMDLVQKVGGTRILNELILILGEPQVAAALSRMQQFDLLKQIDRRLQFDEPASRLFEAAERACSWFDLLYTGEAYQRWLVCLLCLLDPLPTRSLGSICRRMGIKPKYQQLLLEELPRGRQALAAAGRQVGKRSEPKASRIYHWFAGLSLEPLLYLMARAEQEPVRRWLSHFITYLRQVRIELDGNDLKQLGLPPGPFYQEIFRCLLDARLDGTIATRQQELDLVRSRYL